MARFTRPDAVLLVCVLALAGAAAPASDWPQFKHDAGHSASSPHSLPPALHHQWTRQYSPRRQAWLEPINAHLMQFDRAFEPVVAGGRMFLGFSDVDKLVALDVATGRELWRFNTDGPIRLAPAADTNQVYVASDDGTLYCLVAETGALAWKFRGGPGAEKCLGNERLISLWPARGGPVVADGKVHFAAGIWPFMGVFIYALDARTGNVVWVNDTTGENFTDQPHASLAFGGVAPQGVLAATEKNLIVPGSRAVPACLDRKTGKLNYYSNAGGNEGWGDWITANDEWYFARTFSTRAVAVHIDTGTPTPASLDGQPVLHGDALYVGDTGTVRCVRLLKTWPEDKPKPDKLQLPAVETIWEISADASGDLIRAGARLYAAGKGKIVAIDLPPPGGQPQISWSAPVDGDVCRLLAATNRLFAVTLDGRILAFGADKVEPAVLRETETPIAAGGRTGKLAQAATERECADGYAICFDVDAQSLEDLVLATKLRVVAVDSDEAGVQAKRERFDKAGLYGKRITVHHGTPETFKAPAYIASLVAAGGAAAAGSATGQGPLFDAMWHSVRPHGGLFARVGDNGDVSSLTAREGALDGAANWSHQYGDMQNTLKSNDKLVRTPLGVAWFGGSDHNDVLPRHGNGPPQQIVDGRLIIQGLDSVTCRDIYTGRVMWKTPIEAALLATFGVYYDETYNPDPFRKDQRHLGGSRVRGSNFATTADRVYVALKDRCRVLDVKTGKVLRDIHLPERDGKAPQWGFIGVSDDLLLGGWGLAEYRKALANEKLPPIVDYAASGGLVAFDRHSGEIRWQVVATNGFLHNGIVAGNGRIYVLDVLPEAEKQALARRGKVPDTWGRLICLDAATGKELWKLDKDVQGTFLSYSLPRDILLLSTDSQANRLPNMLGITPWQGRGTGITAYDGKSGAVRWQRKDWAYDGPVILHNDRIFSNIQSNWRASGGYPGVLNLEDGSDDLPVNPLTGLKSPWLITRNYGCNYIVASEHLLTFRSGSAGYFDLNERTGTANLSGFKSGCTANMIAAGGLLNAPDYTRTCLCTFQNQTSLGLVHMPDLPTVRWSTQYTRRYWGNDLYRDQIPVGGPVKRLGINLGAPGDRLADDGVLWVEYPKVRGDWEGGDDYDLAIAMDGDPGKVRRRSTSAPTGEKPWVAASCIEDLKWLVIGLNTAGAGAKYTVRLYFAEPDLEPPVVDADGKAKAGPKRVFSVEIQDQTVLENFNVVEAAGAKLRTVVKTFPGVAAKDALKIRMRRSKESTYPPILSGVEILAEE